MSILETNPFEDDAETNPFAEHNERLEQSLNKSTTPPIINDTTVIQTPPTLIQTPVDNNDQNITDTIVSTPIDTNTNTNTNTDDLSSSNEQQQQQVTSKNDDDKDFLNKLLPERKDDNKSQFLNVKVKGIERGGSINNKRDNPSIIFDLQTNLKKFRRQQYLNIKKTYQEFENLFKYLNGAVPETFVPSIPPPFTNFGIKNREDQDKMIKNFQEWFHRLSIDPLLIIKEEFVFFIESDHSTYLPISQYKLPASGLKRKTLKQLNPPYDEVLELAEFRPYVKSIHWISKDIQTKMIKSCKSLKILGNEESQFGTGFTSLNEFLLKISNNNPTQQQQSQIILFKRFGKVLSTLGDIDIIIATLDMATLFDGLEWINKDTYAVKEKLTDRQLYMREVLSSQNNYKNKQEQLRKLKAKRDMNPLKVDEAIRQLNDSTKEERLLMLRLKRITINMKIEKDIWLNWYAEKLRNSIREYTLRRLEYERKKLMVLDRLKNDILRLNGKKVTPISPIKKKNLDTDSQIDKQYNEQQKQQEEDDDELFTMNAREAALMLGTATF